MSNVSSEIVVDALPYIDLGYDDPGVREAVMLYATSIKYLF